MVSGVALGKAIDKGLKDPRAKFIIGLKHWKLQTVDYQRLRYSCVSQILRAAQSGAVTSLAGLSVRSLCGG
ncbi:hypothetical protein RRG08_014530 [Elysia crispata]|uniref:Uncharacterized protein n=1 Tax=Elysia crispata TaxID=231223 RepID=A0AAE1E6U3_9GAST|nr:hypothetical protein RRG08_014530 [Elysia crispata]